MIIRELINLIKFKTDPKDFKKAEAQIQKIKTKLAQTAKVAGLGLLALGAYTVKVASDFEETENKFRVVFQDMQNVANEAAQSIADGFGVSESKAKMFLSGIGDLLTGLGLSQEESLKLADQTTKLGIDLASFTNLAGGAEQAVNALTKGMLGEREMLKSLGVSLTETDLIKFAAEQGLAWKELDKGKRALLTLQAVMKQSKNALGDFQRSSGSFANQLRIMKASIEDVMVAIGQSILPIATSLISRINSLFKGSLGDLLQSLISFFTPILNNIMEVIDLIITEFTPIINRLLGSLMPILSQILGLILNLAKPLLKIISSILEPIMTILEGILPIITEILAIFDKMATDVLGDLQPIFADIMQILSDVLQIVLPILRIFLRLQILMLKLKLLFDTAFIKILVKALRIVLTLLQPLISLLQIFLVPLAEKIENIFTSIIGFFEGIVNTIATKFVDLLNGIFNFINKIIAKINQIPFIKDKLKTLDQINMKEAVNKLTGSSINNNTNNRTQNINLNNQITIQGSDLGNTKNMRRIIDQTARNSFSLELKKILVESGGI